MNKFIANTFGTILAIWHLVVIAFLSYILYLWFNDTAFAPFEPYWLTREYYPYAVVGLFFLHVLISGFFSVIVSIHEQIDTIRKATTEASVGKLEVNKPSESDNAN